MPHHDTIYDTYLSPPAPRNAPPEMQEVWSPRRRFTTWRKVWLAAAEAQHEIGLPVTKEALEGLRAHVDITDEEIKRAFQYEQKNKHDVMAHVLAYGDSAPAARGIIHLGMTSQDV